jgi:hypothetical protein
MGLSLGLWARAPDGDDEAGEDDRAGDIDGGDAGTIRPVRNRDSSAD